MQHRWNKEKMEKMSNIQLPSITLLLSLNAFFVKNKDTWLSQPSVKVTYISCLLNPTRCTCLPTNMGIYEGVPQGESEHQPKKLVASKAESHHLLW